MNTTKNPGPLKSGAFCASWMQVLGSYSELPSRRLMEPTSNHPVGALSAYPDEQIKSRKPDSSLPPWQTADENGHVQNCRLCPTPDNLRHGGRKAMRQHDTLIRDSGMGDYPVSVIPPARDTMGKGGL